MWGFGLLLISATADATVSASVAAGDQDLTFLNRCTTQSPADPGMRSPGCHAKYLGVIFLHILMPFDMNTIIRADDFLLQARAGYGCELEKQVRRIQRHCKTASDEVIRDAAVAMDDGRVFCHDVGAGFQSVMGLSDLRKALIHQLEQDQRCR